MQIVNSYSRKCVSERGEIACVHESTFPPIAFPTAAVDKNH